MNSNGKGDTQRPRQITDQQWEENWHRAFPRAEASCSGTNQTPTTPTTKKMTIGLTDAPVLNINNPKHAATAVVDLRNFIGSVSPAMEHEIKNKLTPSQQSLLEHYREHKSFR